MIDKMIIDAVTSDEKSLSVTTFHPRFLVGTGGWRLVTDEEGDQIIFTDDFIKQEIASVADILNDCELIEGEKLVMFTSVQVGDLVCSLVLFKSMAVGGDDESDVN